MRVELKTDARNERSRAAILALGAQFEGVFRKHMLMPDGRIRDSAWYAITDDEWPGVRARLEARLAAHAQPAGAGVPAEAAQPAGAGVPADAAQPRARRGADAGDPDRAR